MIRGIVITENRTSAKRQRPCSSKQLFLKADFSSGQDPQDRHEECAEDITDHIKKTAHVFVLL